MAIKDRENDRRKFLKNVSALGLVLATVAPLAATGNVYAAVAGAERAHAPIAGTQVFHVKVRGNLFAAPVDVDVYPGKLSAPLHVEGKGTVRLRITPDKIDPHFGPSYLLLVTDAKGKPLDSMKVGSNTTATFQSLGIQVYLLSVQQAT